MYLLNLHKKKISQQPVTFDDKHLCVTRAIAEIETAIANLTAKKATIKELDKATAEKFLFDSYKLLVNLEIYSRDLNSACEKLKPVIKSHLQSK